MLSRIAAFTVFAICSQATAQRDWSIQVRDLVTKQGIANATVQARTTGYDAVTDSSGFATLKVVTESTDFEEIYVQGPPGYNYQVGKFQPNGPRVVYLVPDARFHKTPVLPVVGTQSPIVFQGQIDSPSGSISYSLEVEIPAGVLPEPASFWIAPVPAFASPYPGGADTLVNSAVGQFAIELHDAQGRNIHEVLPSPGITVRFTPIWYPASMIEPNLGLVHGFQFRLTATSQTWTRQPEPSSWNPATGQFEANLRACSWWLILLPLPFLQGDTAPQAQPDVSVPQPSIEIESAECVSSKFLGATFVTCGNISGGKISASLGSGGKISFNAQFVASLTAQLGIGAGDLARLWTRMNASASGSFSTTATGGLDVNISGSHTGELKNGDSCGAPCYDGEARIAQYWRLYTLKVGGLSFPFNLPEGIIKVYCLTRNIACGEPCVNQPYKRTFTLPSSVELCEGDKAKCK